jgi:hypothetical protein
MNRVSKYRRRKRDAWEAKTFAFLFMAMIFACCVDSEGLAYTIAMSGTAINVILAGICEIFASRWS